jgi:ABC-type iron transport system FetAB ATPase subunit
MTNLKLKGFSTALLDPFDLELAAGECVTLSGPSGSGKSRLLRAIADLDPHGGEAWCGETQQSLVPAPSWRQNVGLLPAESAWWREKVIDHFPQLSEKALESLGLPAEALEWQVSRISSGERQRLALLRLFAYHPQVLLLDEPTANLDKANIERAESLIEDWRKTHECAVLWVSHDAEQQRRVASRSLLIQERSLVDPWS